MNSQEESGKFHLKGNYPYPCFSEIACEYLWRINVVITIGVMSHVLKN